MPLLQLPFHAIARHLSSLPNGFFPDRAIVFVYLAVAVPLLWAGLDRVVYGATIADANRHCKQIRIPAIEVAARSDMTCVVDGPLLRDECYALFTHPEMLRAFRLWSTRKQEKSSRK